MIYSGCYLDCCLLVRSGRIHSEETPQTTTSTVQYLQQRIKKQPTIANHFETLQKHQTNLAMLVLCFSKIRLKCKKGENNAEDPAIRTCEYVPVVSVVIQEHFKIKQINTPNRKIDNHYLSIFEFTNSQE